MPAKRKPAVKSPMHPYTIRDLRREFPTDAACLAWLKNHRWPNGIHCQTCDRVTTHHRIASRRSFACQSCGHHVHPTAGTIFHKSSTPLTLWWEAIYLMAQTRMGVSAKQLQRELGVTYKTAWRMFSLIRRQLDEGSDVFTGDVEVDETYIGGKADNMHADKRLRTTKGGRGTVGKVPVIGAVERGGRVIAEVASKVDGDTMEPFVGAAAERTATIYTDDHGAYRALNSIGFTHRTIAHSKGVYVDGDTHTQTIDGFWGILKPVLSGPYRGRVTTKYLQYYVDEVAFRYNHRNDATPMFRSFLRRVALPGRHLSA